MQIDANDMQIAQSQPEFANVLCQAASYGVRPEPVCARRSHLGPRGLGVNVWLPSLQKAFQHLAGRSPSLLSSGLGAHLPILSARGAPPLSLQTVSS